MIYYGDDGMNVDSFGLDSDSFLDIYRRVATHGLKVRQPWPDTQIRFIMYCDALLSIGADISVIVREFNKAQLGDGSDTAHALSLAKLAYHYTAAGHAVEVVRTHPKKSCPDLLIDSVPCELKVRLDQTHVRMGQHTHLLREGRHDEYRNFHFHEIHSHDEDLRRALMAAEPGFGQGDCVFLDLSNHFHTWNYHRLASLVQAGHASGLYDHPIRPVPGTCVLFSPDNALDDRNHRAFRPRAYWGYLSAA